MPLSPAGLDLVIDGRRVRGEAFDVLPFAGESAVEAVDVTTRGLDLNLMTVRGAAVGTLAAHRLDGELTLGSTGSTGSTGSSGSTVSTVSTGSLGSSGSLGLGLGLDGRSRRGGRGLVSRPRPAHRARRTRHPSRRRGAGDRTSRGHRAGRDRADPRLLGGVRALRLLRIGA